MPTRWVGIFLSWHMGFMGRLRRKFEADYVNDIWYGDVMHGPSITVDNKLCKTYLVSLLDDAVIYHHYGAISLSP